jgi:hypothetical protein
MERVAIVRDAETEEAIRSESVVLSAEEYDDLLDQIEFLTELNQAQLEVAAGETLSHEEALAYFRARLGG